MAKQSFEEAKAELATYLETVEVFKAAGTALPKLHQDRIDQLNKIIQGNSSAVCADKFNELIGSVINDEANAELKAELKAVVGKEAKLVVSFDEAGNVSFKATGSSSGGSTGGSGITRSASEHNHYSVTLKNAIEGYASQSAQFESASGAVKFVLNGGKNPMGLPEKFGAGNSMVRVINSYLPKYPAYVANFEIVGSYVAKAPATPETPTTEATV
jgi:hypothetical protein